MTADQRSSSTPDPHAKSVREALFAADLKRLVHASGQGDDDTVSQLRQFYLREQSGSQHCP